MDKYREAISKSNVTTDDAEVKEQVEKILLKADENNTAEVQEFLLSCVDLTTLSSEDNDSTVRDFVDKVNAFDEQYPQYKNVAAVCVYSNFAATVRSELEVSDVNVAVVSANFPSAQARLEVKTVETALAVADGADEVDIVFPVGLYNEGAYEELSDEIAEIKATIKEHTLKVILETGALKTAENIRNASVLAIHSGADFIKTSTGKIYSGATPEAAYVMCQVIKEYNERFDRKIGFKASGGIRTTKDAVQYYTIVKEVLGEEWLTPSLFRIGASSLANNLVADFAAGVVEKAPF